MLLPKRHGLILIVAKVALICLPAVLTMVIIRVFYQASPLDYYPSRIDAHMYWRMIDTFVEAGFHGGHHTFNENPAPIEQVRFYAWGPVYPVIYGLIARLIGWTHGSQIVINLILLTGALLYFVVRGKPNLWQVGLMSVVITSLSVILFYTMIGQEETLSHAIAIGLGTFLYVLISHPDDVSSLEKIASLIFVLCATLLRATWVLLLLPLTWMCLAKLKDWRGRMLLTLCSLPLGAGCYVLYLRMTTPFSGSVYYHMRSLDMLSALEFAIIRSLETIHNFFKFESFIITSQRYQLILLIVVVVFVYVINHLKVTYHKTFTTLILSAVTVLFLGNFVLNQSNALSASSGILERIILVSSRNHEFVSQFGTGIYSVQNYQFIFLVVASAVLLGRTIQLNPATILNKVDFEESILYLFILLSSFGAVVIVYNPLMDAIYRNLSMFMVLIGTVLALRERRWWLLILAIMNLWLIGLTLQVYKDSRTRSFTASIDSDDQLVNDLAQHITYSFSNSSWCNTLLLDLNTHCKEFGYPLYELICSPELTVAIPSGIGMSYANFASEDIAMQLLSNKLQSQWIFTDFTFWSEDTKLLFEEQTAFQLVATTDYGILYYNAESECQ